MSLPLHLRDFVSGPCRGPLRGTPYGELRTYELAPFLAAWPDLHRAALAALPCRIDPTAFIDPTAVIGDDVVIGPNARVHEFTTVRKGSVLCADVVIGFNCEVTRAFIGDGAVLGHRVSVNRSLVGADAHLSANVITPAIHLCRDMRRPDREVLIRLPGGLYGCGTP